MSFQHIKDFRGRMFHSNIFFCIIIPEITTTKTVTELTFSVILNVVIGVIVSCLENFKKSNNTESYQTKYLKPLVLWICSETTKL